MLQVGDAESFFAALSAAEKFCRLGGLLGEARAAFHQRQSNALRRLERSAMDGGEPMTRLQDHAAAATALGADPGAITAALAAAKVRDAEAEKRLVAAVGADPFDPSELRKRLEVRRPPPAAIAAEL